MSATLAYLAVTSAYLGFQLTVRVVIYPQMALVGPATWVEYEAGHQQRVTRVVAPLFVALAGALAWLLVSPDVARPAAMGAAVLLLTLVATTVLGAVPQHRMLSESFSGPALGRLLRWDSARAVLACAQVVLAAVLVRQ